MQKTIDPGDNIAGRPCQSPRRRRFLQFKLRSILVLTGLVGVVLAAWQQFVEPFRFYQSTAKAIAEAGGNCQVVSVGPMWLRGTLTGDLEEIVTLDLPKPEITAQFLPALPRLKTLQELTVSGVHFGDNQLSALRTLRRLRQATLRGTGVTLERVEQIRRERPDLSITVKPLEITFDEDLRFVQPPGQPFDRSLLTARIHGLNGSRVRIQGFLHPSVQGQALLDHSIPWTWKPISGRPLYEVVVVENRVGANSGNTFQATIEGTLSIHEQRDSLTGAIMTVFRLTDAVAVQTKPDAGT